MSLASHAQTVEKEKKSYMINIMGKSSVWNVGLYYLQ